MFSNLEPVPLDLHKKEKYELRRHKLPTNKITRKKPLDSKIIKTRITKNTLQSRQTGTGGNDWENSVRLTFPRPS